ncbi:hypothetical protein T05_10153, partial [Trichinella murrelli]
MLPFFYNISRNTQSGNLGPSSLLFSNFSYIPILFLEKNRFYENFEISWAIDFAVFAFWRVLQILIERNPIIPINGLKLNIISMLTIPEICYWFYSTN